jgi:uncharacterized protein YjdB
VVVTNPVTVTGLPDAGTIGGVGSLCPGATAMIDHSVDGGVWGTSMATVATVDASGNLVAVSAGSATISYTVTNSCGTAIATTGVIITSLPDAGVITGSTTLCAGATSALNNTATGGVWSIDAAAIAIVDASGIVTGISGGIANVAYTVTNSCGSVTAIGAITVNTLPDAGAITGGTIICAGATTTLNDVVTGGAWNTSAAGVATVDASGIVTGVSAGEATMSYSVTNSCGTAIATIAVNINALPDAGTITGGTMVCEGLAISLGNTAGAGVWSIDASGVATIGATGVVTGVTAGVANVYYTVTTSCGSAVATSAVAVGSAPDAGAVSGGATLCPGATTALNNSINGGVWSSSAAGVATIDNSGVVTAFAAGIATMSYTVTNSCGSASATSVVVVNALPDAGAITGSSVCIGSTTTLADAATGGAWGSSDATTASVSASGVVTGVAAGSATVTYTVTNSCGSAIATFPIVVNALPYAGVVTGFDSVCVALTANLTDATTGGVWSSGSATTATVNAAGLVTGVTPGSVTISYTVSNVCGSASASKLVHIKSLLDPGVITGPSHVAYQSIIILTDSVGNGAWSASNANATLTSGIVYGAYPGTVTITCSLSNFCGTATTSKLITVDSPVVYVSGISGPTFFACVGGTAAFWNGTTGGVFTINGSDTAVATTTTGGLVTGISAGTATLSYTVWSTTVTSVLTVYPIPSVITGSNTVCMGATTPLFDATPGGVWTSSIPSTATISPSGVVTGNNAGTVPMSYTMVAPAGCKVGVMMTVNANPAGITGNSSVCPGGSITLHDITPGGTWSGSNGHAIVDSAGDVIGLTAGGVIASYTGPNGCSAIDVITIYPQVGPINGNLNICNGAVGFLADTSSHPLSWTSSTPSVATISASGAVSGVSTGTSIITFTLITGCFNTAVVTINPVPAVSAILGVSSVSLSGGQATLSDLTAGGIWSSSNTGIMTIGSTTGIVTPLFAGGNSTIYYTVTNAFGCRGQASKLITSGPAPHSHGSATTTVGATINIADEAIAGDWSTSDNTVATVDENGVVTAVAPGSAMITHTTTGSDGAVTEAVTDVIVNALPFDIKLFPSPNNGAFSVTGIAGTDKDVNVTIEVANMLGQVVYTSQSVATAGMINSQVSIGNNLTTGNYVLIARNGNENKTIHFVIEK